MKPLEISPLLFESEAPILLVAPEPKPAPLRLAGWGNKVEDASVVPTEPGPKARGTTADLPDRADRADRVVDTAAPARVRLLEAPTRVRRIE